VEFSRDAYGYSWFLSRRDPGDLPALISDLHAVNTALQDSGFGPQLLCSPTVFHDAEQRPLTLVYLYKRGTFYCTSRRRRPEGRPPRETWRSRLAIWSARSGIVTAMPCRLHQVRIALDEYALSPRPGLGRFLGRPRPARGTRTASSTGTSMVESAWYWSNGSLQWLAYLLSAFGWVLTTAVIAGVTRTLQKG
jgi:hypothetical protein